MVTTIISCADLHFKDGKNDIAELNGITNEFIKKCKKIVKEKGKENTHIVIAGDIFESKISVSNEAMVAVYDFLKELSNVAKVFIIAGNHDMLINNTQRLDSISVIMQVGNLDNVVYLDQELNWESGYYMEDNIIYVLYSSFDGFRRPEIEELKERYPEKTLVGLYHGDLKGAKTDLDYSSENALEHSTFDGLDFIIAGHIHRHQTFEIGDGIFAYCGSLKQKDLGENVSGHGFLVWDVEEKKFKFTKIDNKKGGYYKVVITSPSDIENGNERWINL